MDFTFNASDSFFAEISWMFLQKPASWKLMYLSFVSLSTLVF